jgi:hypothetical protein
VTGFDRGFLGLDRVVMVVVVVVVNSELSRLLTSY